MNESNRLRNRRKFMMDGSLLLVGASSVLQFAPALMAADLQEGPLVKLGLITDLHYADRPAVGNRFYRDTLKKMDSAEEQFQRFQPDLVIGLGDIIDTAPSVRNL